MLVTPLPKPTRAKPRNAYSKPRARQTVIDRDSDKCLLCGSPGPGLHLHRVVYGSQGGRYVEGNCVLLCSMCHNPVIHASKATWQPLLMDYLSSEGEARREAYLALQRRFRLWLTERHPTG